MLFLSAKKTFEEHKYKMIEAKRLLISRLTNPHLAL